MNDKKKLGQFFTTNVDSILKGFEHLVRDKEIVDPFAGGGDLLTWAQKNGAKSTIGYDIDPNLVDNKNIFWNDSLLIIPKSKFNLTNPPYLGKNKMTQEQKSKYMLDSYEDFYLLSIKKIIISEADEGIIIIPVNFFSAENSDFLRQEFFSIYEISKVKYFTFQVFADTTYNVVAFHYRKKSFPSTNQKIDIDIYSSYDCESVKISFNIEEKYSYRIAGQALSKITNIQPIKIIRLTEDLMLKNKGKNKILCFFNDKKTETEYLVNDDFFNKIKSNIILINCIDTNASKDGWIKAENIHSLSKDCLVGKISSRNIAYLLLPNTSIQMQREIIKLFNNTLFSLRKKYHSLFLTNFRDNDRKRISFEFCYKLITYCIGELKK